MESEKPEQPKKPFGRSLSDFGVLKSGERMLLDACDKGLAAVLGDVVPESPTDGNCVRAELVRFLLLGGDEQVPVHERGVQLVGAYIEGSLDLSGCNVPSALHLHLCNFPELIKFSDAKVGGVFSLIGSFLAKGLRAERLKCAASVLLRDGFKSQGEVQLLSAQIDDNLSCTEGSFEFAGYAFSADGAKVRGNLNFDKRFKAFGMVRLLGAEIGGDLNCEGGSFFGPEGWALNLEGVIVRSRFLLRGLSQPVCVSASHMDIGVLMDDVNAWKKGSVLDGLRYGAFGGNAPNGVERIAWLEMQHDKYLNSEEFRPQPWRQLQRVLREMGHTEDAKLVGIAYEKHQRKIGRVGQSAAGKNFIAAWWRRIVTRSVHGVFGLLAGYGYRPMRLVTWMLGVWLGCAGLYWMLGQQPYNAIAPSDPLVFQESSYAQCRSNELHMVQAAQVEGQGNWPSCSLMPGEYSTFSPFAYSLDLLLPVVDLGQETAWGAYIPAADEGEARMPISGLPWGYAARWIAWFEILFGWISSLILVATISGFSRRSDES